MRVIEFKSADTFWMYLRTRKMLHSSMSCVVFGKKLDLVCSSGRKIQKNTNVYTKYLPPDFDKIHFVCVVVKFIKKWININTINYACIVSAIIKLYNILCYIYILYFRDDIIWKYFGSFWSIYRNFKLSPVII